MQRALWLRFLRLAARVTLPPEQGAGQHIPWYPLLVP